MKKYLIPLGLMMAATLTLTNCSKTEVPAADGLEAGEGVPFELVFNAEATKTANDGVSTKWVAGDAINVFHVEAGTELVADEVLDNDKFTVSDVENGKFNGTLATALEEGKSYDWYAIYPYGSYLKTRKSTATGGYLNIVSSSRTAPVVQNGNNSTAHLAGQYFPLYGKASNVAEGTSPVIELKQLLSVVKVHVTNTANDPLTVERISFTSTKTIVGPYYIDFTADPIAFSLQESSNASNKTIDLNVENGTAIAKGSSADFYIPVRPFDQDAGTKIVISVNGYEKTIDLAAAASFKTGKVKTVNFDYDFVPVKITAPHTVNFDTEGWTAGTVYNTSLVQGPVSQTWSIYYGTCSTNSKVAGTNSMQLRYYKSAPGNYPYAQMDYDVEDGVNQVSFKAKRNNQDKVKNAEPILLTIYYSTDSGASWTPVPEFTDFELPYLATGSSGDGGGSYAFDVTGNPAKYRLKFAVAEGSRVPTGTWDAIVFDSVKFLNE